MPKTRAKKHPIASRFETRLYAAADADARRFNVSRSFVIAVAAAHSLGVELDYDYKALRPAIKKETRSQRTGSSGGRRRGARLALVHTRSA